MRSRPTIWILLCLLLAAGAWLFWRPAGHRAAGVKFTSTVISRSTAPKILPGSMLSTSAVKSLSASVKTNRFAYRLSNTSKSIRELTRDDKAILLDNALIETGAKLNLSIPKNLRSQGDPGAYIVQARGLIDARFRALLASAGAQIVSYIPNNAYLVRISAAGAGGLSGNGLVQAVLPFEPYYKLQPSLLGLAVAQQPLPPGTALNVGLFAADAPAAEQQIENLGGKIIGTDQSPFGPVLRVLAPADWTPLAQVSGVQVMEVSRQRVPANDLSRVTVGVAANTQTIANWLNLSGSNVLVQVNDSGIDATHPDLANRVFGLNPIDLVDTNGHGTHVAGIIAGSGLESMTVSNAEGSIMPATNGQFRGMADEATLFSVNNDHSDQFLQELAASTNALISNNSWVYDGDFDYDLAAASYDAATRDALPFTTGSQPVLFVFAAGNNGEGNDNGGGGAADTIQSPATAKNVITVGALEQLRHITNIVTTIEPDGTTNTGTPWFNETDSSNQVAGYSARGNVGVGTEGAFGRFKPDVVSPGTFVVSTRSSEWATNAYFNPTNVSVIPYTGQLLETNALNYYNVLVPANAVGVTITITANNLSPNPFPSNLLIYAQQSGYPDPVNAPGSIDYTTSNNVMSIPPGGGNVTIPNIQNNGFDFAVGDSTTGPVNYDMTVAIYTTNDVTSDYYQVLLGMDNQLGPYYRYETGTSMAAADVSGVLALLEDYFTNTLQLTPSPALLKAMLINGSRSGGGYSFAITNGVNFQGWGTVNIANSLPLTNNSPGSQIIVGANPSLDQPLFFVDQSPTNALATGDSHTYTLTIDTNDLANELQMQATLAWTDPPGDPAAAIKLVNSLTLVITNLDDPSQVYYGNDISPAGYNLPSSTNGSPNVDMINNVQNILLPPLLAGSYSVTVVGRSVNVNAVTAQTNNVVQDYALVVSVGEGEVPTAISSVTDNGIVSNPTGDQDITFVGSTNTPLLNQIVGANTPLLGTNTLPLGTDTVWGSNGQLTLGMTNQWHFYVVTNNALDSNGNSADVTNAAFITFDAFDLSVPRTGVYADSVANATRPAADIDLYVSTDSSLTNLDPAAISNCLAGTVLPNAIYNSSSLSQGGTEFVYDTNSFPGKVYYVGVKSEDQMASEYGFLPVFTATPFGSVNPNGDLVVNGLLLPDAIPDGDNAQPGVVTVFALAIPLIPNLQVADVTVTNLNEHQNFGDLFGALTFGTTSVVLNNHDGLGNTFGTSPLVYDDSVNQPPGTQHTDGPGSLMDFQGQSAIGPWILTESDNSLGFTGQVSQFTLVIQPQRNLQGGGITNSIPPLSWFIDYVDVPAGYTNLIFSATNLPPVIGPPPLQMYEQLGAEPTLTDFDQEADLTNCITGTYPTGIEPGNSISVGPPLNQGRYFIGIYNPSATVTANVFLSATLGLGTTASTSYNYTGTNGVISLLNDAVTSDSGVFVSATQAIASVNVGMVVTTPQISDYTFTLVSPTGQRILLMENRGGYDTNGAGSVLIYTNVINSTATGGAAANTNYLAVSLLGETIPITYNFYTVPDEMTVYDGTNPADFYIGSPTFLYDTGLTNNPLLAGGGAQNTQPVTILVNSQPGFTNITIIMNQFGNPDASGGDAWIYTAGAAITNFEYLMFTDDTNLATVPIKFAVPPYNFNEESSNYTLSDFELATNGNYFGPTNIYDANGGWTVPTNLVTVSTVFNITNNQFVQVTNVTVLTNNEVSVVTDPADSLGDNVGSNFLALADGTITRSIPTTPGRLYNVTFWYRGPGIASWWRGEGDATDSSDPEKNANNGSLIGRFDFPAGEVGQAFQFEDAGVDFEFAGTNTYVQIRQSSSLDVGAGGGFTVEGWINPTNVSFQQPLVEWLAKVPTNSPDTDTNFSIVAGPFLDRATSHYYYLLAATNWTTSETWATMLGGHLATVDTANEENWIYDAFASYAGTNRGALWIGLTNAGIGPNGIGPFGYSSGLTNVVYTNWANAQPANCDGNEFYTAIVTATNAESGLWVVANNNGISCPTPTTNIAYGVVEVNNLQTNGVQFWISVTNTPGTTNSLVSGNGSIINSNGCLYADIVDVSNVTHEIFSAPGLIQSNVFQHVALTFNTNSGIAALYYNGTNVATTNLFMTNGLFVPFVPKTGGDVLLGRDMSLDTNNFFGGEMDEMSIYSRALSGAEISAIYNVSAGTTNRLIGKFDPTVTPAYGLAEAEVTFGTTSNLVFGVNDQWELNSYTFTATSNSMPLQITGLEPGILLDDFSVSEAPLTNLYYLPEQSLSSLVGDSAYGNWTLQVWDNRDNALVTNISQLVSWQLQFVLESNATVAGSLSPQTPTDATVGPGQTVDFAVTVPSWANDATNILVSSDLPVSLFFNQTSPPTGTVPPDLELLANSTAGIGVPALVANPASTPPLLPGQTYYLGVQNNGVHAASVVLEVDYDITVLTNGVPYTSVLKTNDSVRYFAFDVSSNAFEATFQLLHLSSNADLVVSKGPPLPTLFSDDYGSFNVTNSDENIYVLTNSSPVPLSAGRWYLGVFKRDSGPVDYTVLAKELDATNGTSGYSIINLTNGVPFNFTSGPGAALTNFFSFIVTNTITSTVTNIAGSIYFELYNLSGNGDLTVQTDAPPFAPPFFQSSQQPGTTPELIFIRTNNVLTNLATDWYLGVPNRETNVITYTIIAAIVTNGVFAAFPGAEGAGAGAIGGRFGDVYHVINLNDSGAGSLRAAVNSTTNSRTVVFDISGTINLSSPLVITNSFLTIAGQTAPGGGITVAGNMTTVQSAHDVVIRDIRFRPVTNASTNPVVVWSNGFEANGDPSAPALGSYTTPTSGNYFAGGWHVDFGSVDWLSIGAGGPGINTPYEGNYFIDLDGSNAGGISTNIATVSGVTYTLGFAYTKNPDHLATPMPQVQILINSNPLATVTVNITNSAANLNWQTTSFVFTATSPSTALAFKSLDSPSSDGGVYLDAVSLTTNVMSNLNPGDSLQFTNVLNVVADHVSASWTSSNLVSVLNSSNVTVQWSIIADGLYNTNNPQSSGSLLRYGNGALSFSHNLYADNYNGSPRLGDNLKLDFVNNVIYNWGTNAGFSTNENTVDDPSGFTNELNYVGNYLIAGSNSVMTNIAFWSGTTNTWIFQTNNFMDGNKNGILDGANTGWNMFTNKFTETNQFPPLAVSIDEAFVAYERVLDFAGPDMAQRDSVDTNIVGKVRSQTGQLISTAGTASVLISTLPYLDTDQDGIPDFWENTFGTDPFTPNNNVLASDGSGYTDLEEYNNWLAAPHALTVTNTPVGVDLKQMFGQTGNLSFFLTNAVNGSVYLTNVLGSVTNTGTFSNSIAVFTPTNNYSGYASFDVYVTNNDTVAYFGPVTVSVVVSKVPVAINSNMPPVITPLLSGVSSDPTNYGGSDFYSILVPTNAAGALFELDNPTGPMAMVIRYGLPLPSLSSYNYYTNLPPAPASLQIAVLTNSMPVPLQPGTWYMAAVNESGSNVVYTAKITLLGSLVPPLFLFPTNTTVITNLETVPLTISCVATDLDTPPLPLTFALVSGPVGGGLTVSNNGVINWTPTETQGPSTNLISVSVANGIFSVTNSFTIVVEESNLPPVFVLTNIPNQIVIVPDTLVVTNSATDPDIPANPLAFRLLNAPPNAMINTNSGVITWTPTLAQAGTNYLFTTVVTDTNQWAINSKSLSATNYFTVTVLPPLILTNGLPQTNSIPPDVIEFYTVNVPANADFATNILLFAAAPVNVWFSTNLPPTIINSGDVDLIPGSTVGSIVLGTNGSPANTTSAYIVPGGTYYLGVQNTNSFTVTNCAVKVNFHYLPTFGGFGPITTDGTNLFVGGYITNAGNAIFALTPTNLAALLVIYSNLTDNAWGLAINGTNLYWINPTNGGTAGTTAIFGGDTGGDSMTSDYPTMNIDSGSDITSDGTQLFVADEKRGLVFSVPYDFSSENQIGGNRYAIAFSHPNSLAVANGVIYVADSGKSGSVVPQVVFIATNGASFATNHYGSPLISPSGIAVSGGALFVADPGATNTIWMIPATTNGTATVVASGPPFRVINRITYLNHALYITDNDTNGVNGLVDQITLTNPMPVIGSVTVKTNGVTLHWSAPIYDEFQVQCATNLVPPAVWNTFSNAVISTTGAFTFTDTNSPVATKFYRLVELR